ncbi:S9 family peptidase [Lacticaseibacillus nasuensis]|uniref:S9 family peptidase n=1 Tax=Lacticaseibacillus nasuensis TaxID=944671 RepID=UPI0022471CB8|nr:S9 family peptidase [Lacticaseibacillus nasuensis]MCX2456216.1 S9 family peptidase [Lacticaseibacillus nasuensis]
MQVKPTDLFNITTLSYPSLAGNSVFFQENWIDQATNQYYSRIRQLDRRTRHQTAYGHDGQHDHAPQVNAAGTILAFLSQDADQHTQVFTQAVTGGNATQLTHERRDVEAFDWAGDAAIAYVSSTRPDTDSKFPQAVTVTKAQYKLNGAGLLPEDVTTTLKLQKLSNQTGKLVYASADGFSLGAVAPAGDQAAIAYEAKPADPNNFATAAAVVDLTTGELTDITTSVPGGEFSPAAFSHDGKQLLLVGKRNEQPNIEQTDLWHYDIASGALTDTTADQNLEIGGLIVADTQQGLSGRITEFVTTDYYLSLGFDHGAISLYTGGPDQALTPLVGGQRHITDWAVGPDQREVVFTSSDLTTPSQLRVFDLVSEEETLLYDPNARYARTHDLVAPSEYSFERAGYTIQGWYYAPVKTAKKHPAVLYIHGGPQAGYGYTFFHEMQVLANAGYGVINVNPRGGLGYGQDFTAAVIGHYGEGDYEDLMMSVDEAMKLDKKIDAKRLYVTGGSYGGFMTNWVVGHTDRFKAAATARSIANWISFYGTSDIGYYFTPWEITGEWTGDVNDIETLWRYSPLAYADHVKTPTLVLHGEQDQRCPIGQGEEFYTALKLRGVDTKFIRFPQSNHELSRSGLPNLRIVRMQAIMDWFDAHQ